MADEAPPTSPGKRIMGWIGTISALIGFGVSIAGGIHWYLDRREHKAEFAAQMALADAQRRQGEYAASVNSYNAILKDNPLDPAALRQQQQTAMEWVENFRAVGDSGQSAAGPELDQIMTVLDAALTRSKGSDAADIEAHLGWAHWLNQKIAQREFGSTAEDDLRAALKLDPDNVYANAMLGNWMLQNGGASAEAIQHFKTAVATGKVRPFVRRFEIGAISPDRDNLLPELFKVANEMRRDGEPLDSASRKRIAYFCCTPPSTEQDELVACLSAVPKDEAWPTYQWLIEGADPQPPQPTSAFVHATLLEISGDKAGSLRELRSIQQELRKQTSSLGPLVDSSISRLAVK